MLNAVLVEDDPTYAEELVEFLAAHGLETVWLKSLDNLVATIRCQPPDILVLDQFVGGQDVLTLLPDLRHSYTGGLVVLTGNEDVIDRVVALETGADDFVVKSLGPRELLARLRAVLRRVQPQPAATDRPPQAGKWLIDARQHKVQAPDGAVLRLTVTELHMLIYLIANPGRVLTRDELSLAVLRRGFTAEDRGVDNMLSRIRSMIGPHVADRHPIRSMRGRGYVFAGLDLAEESNLRLPGETSPGVKPARI